MTHPPPLSPAAARRCGSRPKESVLEDKWLNTEEKSIACWGHFDSGANLDQGQNDCWSCKSEITACSPH